MWQQKVFVSGMHLKRFVKLKIGERCPHETVFEGICLDPPSNQETFRLTDWIGTN